MVGVAINGALPKDIGTGFAEIQEWEFDATCHPIIPAWFGKHFACSEGGWAPTQLLAFLTESGLLRSLKVREAIISFENQTEVWLPENRDQGCSVIGKFTQGAKADGKKLTRRLVTDRGELDCLVRDTRLSGILVRAPLKCELGHILTYYDGSQPQFMMAYAHINLLSMLQRFEPDEAVQVATDSIYVQTAALHKLEGVKASKLPKDVTVGRSCACSVYSRESTSLRSPLANGGTKASRSSCPRSMQPTSPGLTRCAATGPSLLAPRRATMTR